ncbi:MAG: hypothetical protein ABJA98_12800 [Acidobacteriota bacterium]
MDVVVKYTVLCALASRIPAWWANSASVTGLQLKMLAELSSVYEVEFRQDLAVPMIGSLAGGGLSFLVSQNPLAMALKFSVAMIPVVGIPLRFATGPAIIGGYCYMLGRAFVDHYEAGGTYHDFNPAKLRATVRAALTPARA